MEQMHLNLAALHNVKFTYIEVLLCVMFVKAQPDIQRLQKGQGVPECVNAYICVHICPALFHKFVRVCVYRSSSVRMCGWFVWDLRLVCLCLGALSHLFMSAESWDDQQLTQALRSPLHTSRLLTVLKRYTGWNPDNLNRASSEEWTIIKLFYECFLVDTIIIDL